MKSKSLFLIILVLITVGLAAYGYFKATPGVKKQVQIQTQPQIEITPKSFDFGEIEYGKTVKHTFKVKNLGNEVLEIKRLSTSCGCTKAEISKEKLGSKEETELKVTYDTGAMSGSHAKGKQERTIYIKSSDPVKPQLEVMIYALVK